MNELKKEEETIFVCIHYESVYPFSIGFEFPRLFFLFTICLPIFNRLCIHETFVSPYTIDL